MHLIPCKPNCSDITNIKTEGEKIPTKLSVKVGRSLNSLCKGGSKSTRKILTILPIAASSLLASTSIASAASIISPTEFSALALRCAPQVSVDMLEAVARAESGLNPWALHDNTTDQTEHAASQTRAEADANQWISHGDSVDLGLMQINSENLSALGLTVKSALDPCASLAAGAAILRAAYGSDDTPATQQVALLMALSRYNTGSPIRGIMNGYAHKVMTTMTSVDQPMSQKSATNSVVIIPSDPNTPPSWNVAAEGSYEEVHGAPWLVPLLPNVDQTSIVR